MITELQKDSSLSPFSIRVGALTHQKPVRSSSHSEVADFHDGLSHHVKVKFIF